MKNAEKKTEQKTLTNAYIIPEDVGERIIEGLKEVPYKYAQVGGILRYLIEQVYRGDVTIQVPVKENNIPEPQMK